MTMTTLRPSQASLAFSLPPELEAHEPPEARGLKRDEVRLIVTHHRDNRIHHARFTDLPELLLPGDLLVANDSATIPPAITGRRQDGSQLDIHLSTQLADGIWVVEPRHSGVELDETVALPGGGRIMLLAPYGDSHRLWVAGLDLPVPVLDYLNTWGRPIRYPYLHGEWPLDSYQTIYARAPGSAEMPSAGRAFSSDVLTGLARSGVGFTTLTLHTGVASLEAHERPYAEPFIVPPGTARAVNEARSSGRPVIAVGTTVVRALESTADLAAMWRRSRAGRA